ncbi:helix-turn-helix domain-containing protein [Trichodesmium erythraeum]|uniref:helix-turn-helix domain-containing protein n=1 Tax=Trichodesmium erythraeum TaxID=1206 RepID=UPI0002E03B37|nr:helix-turn-helix domain-containing protein [Trichodesmium erythraeum GBRTRLIN201]
MKARFKYCIYPNGDKNTQGAKLFVFVHFVLNESLDGYQQKYKLGLKKLLLSKLQKLFMTQAKKIEYQE